MKGSGREDPAIHRLRQHIRSLRTDPPMPIKDLQAKLEGTLGKIPMFPNQFIYVVNYATHEVLFAQGFERVLGYPDASVNIELLYTTWHPDDAPVLAKFSETVTRMIFSMEPALQPFEATMMVDYRVRRADGQYIKVMRHTSIFDVDGQSGRALSTFSLCMDISNVKTSDRVGWQFYGPGVARLDLHAFDPIIPRLEYRPTPRELDILRLLLQGLSSKDIAQMLGLSLLTVKTHRRNLIERTGSTNTAALVRLAIEQGWSGASRSY